MKRALPEQCPESVPGSDLRCHRFAGHDAADSDRFAGHMHGIGAYADGVPCARPSPANSSWCCKLTGHDGEHVDELGYSWTSARPIAGTFAPTSINAQLEALPPTGVRSFEAHGRLLFLPRTGLTVVPFRDNGRSWGCVVVDAPEGSLYPVGGFDIDVSCEEIERAIPRSLTALEAVGE